MGPRFVDCHSHVTPSGDDGVATVEEGAILCGEAARRGTAILFATPHVWPHLPLTAERERQVRDRFAQLTALVESRVEGDFDLRLGFELTPTRTLVGEDLGRYVLDGTRHVLMEVPFAGSADVLWALAEEAEQQGLQPVIAHPERTETVIEDEAVADALGERYLLQVNATSLLGRHGPTPAAIGWRLLEEGRAALVASDGHRLARPPFLDEAYELAEERLGLERALRFFDGSALGATGAARPATSRAAPRGV